MIAAPEDVVIDLIRRAGRGDEMALRELQQLTRHLLGHCIRRFVKDSWREEEVLQDVYTFIWQHAKDYRRERGTPWAGSAHWPAAGPSILFVGPAGNPWRWSWTTTGSDRSSGLTRPARRSKSGNIPT